MPLSLYADECIDGRIVAGLRRRGVDVVTAVDVGLLGRSDDAHLEKALALGRVIVSRDQDFLVLAHRCAETRSPSPGLIFVQPRATIGEIIRAISLLSAVLTPEEMAGWIEWVP